MPRQRMIVCRTLGPVQAILQDGSAPADLQWAKNLALLVYLARSPEGTRTREHLIGLLWGDKPESKARQSLNTALSLLRGYAGDEGVVSDSTRVSLRPGGVQLDTEQLEAFLAARDFAAAVALIRGEFLEGFGIKGASQFDDWLAAEREHWRRRSVEALLCGAELLLAGGDVAGALELGERALALDRESEAALRALMRGLALAGDRAGALKQFDAFAARLARELGTEPAPDTRALATQVRLERTWRLPKGGGGGGAASAGGEPRRTPLVGRARELEQLVAAWIACRRERHPAVAVIGYPKGDPQPAEVDWAFAAPAQWRLARLLERTGGRTDLCRAYGEVARRWAGGEPRFRARADSAARRSGVAARPRCGGAGPRAVGPARRVHRDAAPAPRGAG
ncbi:MAG: hypothetical protein DMD73_15200 [Gemmatimonadetes bacterium]|nr:MAG: hypothetical protein DMD73_15200 [Gemmatimonadota bacterium]